MSEFMKMKLEQTLHALDTLVHNNQQLLRHDSIEDDLFALCKRYTDERKVVKQLEHQLKSATLKTKSQSQQIQDQRQRRLLQSNRANRLHKTIQHIYEIINYHSQQASSVDQLHYIKKLCEDRLREGKSSSDEDEDEVDSHNCTIDDEHNESIILHPRVVLPQSSSRKRRGHDLTPVISPSKRFRPEKSPRFLAQTKVEYLHATRPITITTDIQIIDQSCYDDQSSSSSTINSTKSESTSSIEQTLPDATSTLAKMPTLTHRFISRKIFKPETCFVCLKRINFGSISYRCSYCSQSSHVTCKESANAQCRSTSNKAMLPPPPPPFSPKTPIVPTLKTTHRQRIVSSEPRKSASVTGSSTSMIQRRLPFERILLLKK